MTRPRRLAALLLTLATPATAIEYKVDRSHSTVGFTVPIMGGLSEVTGKFSDFQVTLTGSEADPAGGHVLAIIRTGSIDTGIAKRDEDLRSDGFFDATRFPEIRFESRSIRKTGDGWEAAGPLTMHGVTRDIVLPFRFTGRFASSPEDDRPLIGLEGDDEPRPARFRDPLGARHAGDLRRRRGPRRHHPSGGQLGPIPLEVERSLAHGPLGPLGETMPGNDLGQQDGWSRAGGERKNGEDTSHFPS